MKPILVYDVNVLPYGMNAEQLVYMFEEHNIVFYDGTRSRNDCKPTVYGVDDSIKIKLIDTKLLKVTELKELIKGIEEVYDADVKVKERSFSIYDSEYCNYGGKVVSKYVYYVREIRKLSKEEHPMSSRWLTHFEAEKEDVYFPPLTISQVAQLDMENQSKRV